MQSLSQREYQASVMAIGDHLKEILSEDGPFKPKYDGIYFNYYHMAEALIKLSDQVEMDYENKSYEARVASRERTPF